MENAVKLIAGMAVAAAAGAAIGMLLAPEKGKDLRKKIKDEAEDLLRDFRQMVSAGKEFVSEIQKNTKVIEIEEVKQREHD